MEIPTISGLRSRSRSKTPFLRSSCDRESCTEGEEHTHKSGRKTPIKRSTPIKQIQHVKKMSNVLKEDNEESSSVHRTRQSSRQMEKLVKTSDYSSEESLDRIKGNRKEIYQNEINSQYERVSTSSQRYSTLADVTLSPILTSHHVTQDRSTRYSSPAVSACSTDSSFAEQALADASALLERDPAQDHLPYRLYKMAGEYWNKYPKTDYTYSPLSRDRVELAPGQVAVPNMSRRSLSQFRIQGPATDEADLPAAWRTSTRKRFTTIDSSDDESAYVHNGHAADQRWWLTRLLTTIITTITTTTRNTYRKVVGPSHRYPYTERRPARAGIVSSAASVAMAPFYWIFTLIKTIVTTTTTTITETISPSKTQESEKYSSGYKEVAKRRWWPWLFLLVVPAVGCGLHHTYENYEHILPNFTNFSLDLSEFSAKITNISMPKIPDMNFNFSIPEIIPLSNMTDLPAVTRTYKVYREVVQNRMSDASEYIGYTYKELIWKENIDNYKPPEIIHDSDLTKRFAALENWAMKVDTRLNYFDQKLSKIDNLDARIEQYSFKHLQQNLIQILNDGNSEALAAKLKQHFDKNYVSKEQMLVMSQEIHERLLNAWQAEMSEDRIRQIVQEYLFDVEKRQMETVVEKVRDYVREVELRPESKSESSHVDLEEVKKMVVGMLQIYDADKTGLVDYALESAGGQILSTKCTELYQIKSKQYSILGVPVWWVHTSPRHALTPGAMPAECWAFQGFPGYLVIRTYAIIEVTGFSLEHMSRLLAVEGKIESAPKNFSVYGLHGEMDTEPHLFGDYIYDVNGTSIQYFPVKHPKTTTINGVEYPVAYDTIELRVESNHGNPTYTCIYRFRVHGNPLTNFHQAEDSVKNNES